uniref:Uncharacterized protein n=1 Tax=viral metagenome TaxID=1070528 RepID=A0A6C0EAD9_9ZZZZ
MASINKKQDKRVFIIFYFHLCVLRHINENKKLKNQLQISHLLSHK